MEHGISVDGTSIAYQRSGAGPPLILVHGAVTDHTRWNPLLKHINERFTVYAMDRRGRGESGDATDHSFDLEAEDVVAVANTIDEPVNLYGHSGGATFVLEAALRIRNPHRLVLYEPVIPPGAELFPSAFIEKLQHLVDEGEQEGVITTFLQQVARMPLHEIEHLRGQPEWRRRTATAHTVPRELRSANDYRFDAQRFKDLQVPTLLLVGSDSPEVFKKSAAIVQAALPHSQIHELPGQQHLADVISPEMIASVLTEFLGKE